MTVSASLSSGDVAPTPAADAIPAFIFPSETGAGSVYQFDPNDDVYASLGSSDGTEGVLWFLRNAGQSCVVGICAGTPGTKSAVTQVGSGPAITAGYTGALTAPLLSTLFRGKITAAGALGAGQLGYCLDGSNDYSQYTATLPQEGAAVLRGTVDIANGAVLSTCVGGSVVDNHLDFTAPTADVLTFSTASLTAATAGLKVATATVASIVVLTVADLLAPGLVLILAHPRKLLFTTAGGTAADAPASVAIVGTRYGVAMSETLSLSQTAGTVSSVNTYDVITSLTYPAADGTGATIAIGYSDAYATAQEIADDFNALAIAAGLAVLSRVAQTSLGSFLEIYSTSLGVGVTMTLDLAASTADTALGFATASATGATATLPLAFTGITLTFASGTYVLADTYSFTTTGPSASTSAIATAADNIRFAAHPFGYLLPLNPTTDANNTAGLCAVMDAKVTTWDTDPEAPIFPIQLTPGPFHTASTSPVTTATNIATVDQALIAAFAAQSSLGTVIPGDGYATGSKVSGSYRRPAALGVAYMLSAFKLSDDPGAATHGAIPEWSLVSPDGVTLARDQANPRTVNKLGGSAGPGFTVLRTVNGGARVVHGVTRAGAQSRLQGLGPGLRMGRRGQAVLYDTAKNGIENETFAVDANGRLLESLRRALEGVFFNDLADALLAPPLNNNASSVSVVIDAAEKIANTDNITVTATLQKLGVAENVTIRAIVAGTVVSATIA